MSQTPKKINLAAYKKIVRDFLLEKNVPPPEKITWIPLSFFIYLKIGVGY